MKMSPATTPARITPRQRRLIQALLSGPIYRIQADKIAGATNSPHNISELRHIHGLSIITKRVEHIDRDGIKTRPGMYILQQSSFELAKMLLKRSETPPHRGS